MAFTVRSTPVRATKAVVRNKPFVQQPEIAAAQAERMTLVRVFQSMSARHIAQVDAYQLPIRAAEPEEGKEAAEDAIDGFKSEIREVAEGAKEKADEGAVALDEKSDEAKEAIDKMGSVQFDE